MRLSKKRLLLVLLPASLALGLVLAACGGGDSVTLYTDRSDFLVGSLLKDFAQAAKVNLKVRPGTIAGLTATIQEEGSNSPADVVYFQDAGPLTALAEQGFFEPLPDDILTMVDPRFRSPAGQWVGASGRARTVVYNRSRIDPSRDLPKSILDFADPRWKGRIGWAPAHGETQAFITALRAQLGDVVTRQWLQAIQANNPKVYSNNIAITQAVADGEVDVGFVNHYYVYRFIAERGEGFNARNYFFGNADPGAFVDASGVGVLKTSRHKEKALEFVRYLLGKQGQDFLANKAFEFPLVPGNPTPPGVPALSTLEPPNVDPAKLTDLRGTLNILRDLGILP